MNQLADSAMRNLPTPIRRDLGDHVRRLGNALFGGQTLAHEDAPTPTLRRDLENRRLDLEGWLAPSGKDHVRAMIASVLQVMPAQGGKGSAEDASKVQALYVHTLADLPHHAVKAACEAALRNDLGEHWAPTPGDLRVYAERYCETLVRERRAIAAILAAPLSNAPVKPERKAALIEAARKLGAEMCMNRAIEEARRAGRDVVPEEIPDLLLSPEAQRERHLRRLEELKAMPLPKFSPDHRRRLGLPPERLVDQAPFDDRFGGEHAA